MWTHPLGGELRCEIDGEMFGTRASRDLNDLLDASAEWRKAFEGKGWTGARRDLRTQKHGPAGVADEQKSVTRQIEHARQYATRKG